MDVVEGVGSGIRVIEGGGGGGGGGGGDMTSSLDEIGGRKKMMWTLWENMRAE